MKQYGIFSNVTQKWYTDHEDKLFITNSYEVASAVLNVAQRIFPEIDMQIKETELVDYKPKKVTHSDRYKNVGVALKFNSGRDPIKPEQDSNVLVYFQSNFDRGDELCSGIYDGEFFVINNRKIHPDRVTGWIQLPLMIPYDSTYMVSP